MAAQRRALLLFGIVFVALFGIVAISEGIGDPSVPSGDVALVEDAPGDLGEVTQAKFDRALFQAGLQQGLKKAPKPSNPKYEEVKDAAMLSLLETIWLQGLAAEEGIEVTDKAIEDELEKLKNENFQTPKEFQDFMDESGYNQADVRERVALQMLSTRLQEQIAREAPKPSKDQIEDYYDASAKAQFTSTESRDVRAIFNKDRKKAQEALDALSGDNTAQNWKKVTKKYSEGEAANSGGLRKGIAKGSFEEPVDKAMFSASEGALEGLVKTKNGFYVFEVTKIKPEAVQELNEVEGQIEGTLAQEIQQEFFNEFIADFSATWRARTFCASGYEMERCANFTADGRPESAPPACYEEDPDGGRPEACPAPVYQLIPALPGSVTPIEPKGNPLAQRPQPGQVQEAAAPEGLPPGVVPAPPE